MSRRERGRVGFAVTVSVALHAALVGLFWATASRAEALPEMRVYAVDLVSPPPQQQGEWSPEPVTPPAEATPEPEAAEPEPEPPAPEPEPAPAPPVRKPEPEKPKPQPEKPKPQPEKPKPQPERPRETKPETPRAETPKEEAPRARPSTGRNPDPNSPGGEGLNVQLNGLQCFDPGYCENIIRQVNRYFRSPAGAAAAEADIYFVIQRDGSVDDLRVISNTGGVAFKLAVLEAVEQAGLNKAFGRLPSAHGDQLPVRFTFRPAR